MSYSRLGVDGSDVYVYGDATGWACCFCALNKGSTPTHTRTRPGMIAHLARHRAHGHTVPGYVFADLFQEWVRWPGRDRP